MKIIFHTPIRNRLLREYANGRYAQSYLFIGPRGVGKYTLARWYAQALMCVSHERGVPCDACSACRACAAGAHPDARGAHDRSDATVGVDEWRTLQDRLTRTPLYAQRSVAIVPDCERLSHAAQHACLKTLEEPRPSSVLILTAASTATLLPTVCSRLSIIRLRPVPSAVLGDALKESDASLSSHAVNVLLDLARGIPGKIMCGGTVLPSAFDLVERMRRIAAITKEPLWAIQQIVRENINKERVHETLGDMLSPVIRRRSTTSAAAQKMCLALSRALTHTVHKDLALDAFGIILAQP